ncbi:MAG: hypothetical protein F4Y24_08375 [Gemmatimonadetes bacterium]|nr:hypothetical protein [Gemmatimonadota bacterium]MYG23181.1 hypothetical protein [Gemmatimonadota bacterium]MYJ40057.1 hypothetical protein [Gemmatimonadota bacterium]
MNRNRIFTLAAATLSATLWAYACGDGATEPRPPPSDPPRPTTVTVSPATAELAALGATVQLSAEVRDQNGQVMAGATAIWASDNAPVATVDGSGLVTSVGNGTATITATAGAVSGSAAVSVAQRVSAVTVSPAADTLVARDTLRLEAEATDANGHAVAEAGFSWASSDTSVAVVDDAGRVTGVAPGEAEVTATAAEVTGRADLMVVAPAPTTIAVTPDTVALAALGQTAQLSAEVRDQAGRSMEGVSVSWSSADTTVAAVDSAGLVTAAGVGETTITPTAGEVFGEAVVSVMQSAGSVVVSPATDTVAPGDTLRLGAEAFDANGHRVEGARFDWSSSDAAVVRVDGSGLVTAVAEGAATITAKAGDARGTAKITVQNPDRAALEALYKASDGPNWANNENWLTDAPLGDWYGVDTDGSGRVARLDLGGRWDSEAREYVPHGLTGPIPPEISSLANLEWLNLSYNQLTGPIPSELGNLAKLTRLDLRDNQLTGAIPTELGSLASLTRLYLRDNQLTGAIPPEFGSLASLTRLHLGQNQLTGPIPPELGNLVSLRFLWLYNNTLTGLVPSTLGSLASLEGLDVYGNSLSGPIPPELSKLARLTRLQLGSNSLSGPIPRSLLDLTVLTRLYFDRNDGLCAPGVAVFADWLGAMEDTSGPYCNEADVAALERLFETAGGTGWSRSDGWLATPALRQWHGVTADTLGRVETLDLRDNELAGEMPNWPRGALAKMTELRISANAGLAGRLPLSLADLSLRVLHYAGTDLCAPGEAAFTRWLNAVTSHQGTGVKCAQLSDREILEIFYEATGGPNWVHNDNWLTDAPLGQWYGVEVDNRGRVTELYYRLNGLTGRLPPELGSLASLQSLFIWLDGTIGSIPPELGNLTNLRYLRLMGRTSHLTGSIPPELGRLAKLQVLELWNNELTGPIPPELGGLADLRHMRLDQNQLTGSIPPELGRLAKLNSLHLLKNELTGPIPPELGSLTALRDLNLATNRLTGRIPRELGGLAYLRGLYLGENDLTGPVPPVLGRLTHLRHLALQTNAGMSGALPASLTNLESLETLQTHGTDLCAPSDAGFLDWLERVASRRVALCGHEPSVAYLVQAVQSREFPVPLVAGREALLRVFVTAGRDNDEPLPPVRASFYLNGALAHVAEIAGKAGPIRTHVDEGSLATSANAAVPADMVQPGLEMVIEVDPDGALDPGLGVARRIPETGRAAVDVRAVPLLDLTLLPFLWTENPDSTILEPVLEMAADPEGHEMLEPLRTLLPVGDLDVRAHEPVLTSTNDGFELVELVGAIRAMEGGTGYWMGAMSGPYGTAVVRSGGVGLGVKSFVGLDERLGSGTTRHFARVTAHEFGHNFSLGHAPSCGAGLPDPAYPEADGWTGVWGYNFRTGSLVPPSWYDVMGYCQFDPEWISDYHFSKALHFRLNDDHQARMTAQRAESLLLWGGADGNGELYLNPAFVVDAQPALPNAAGEHRIAGRTADGSELFSLTFTMPETADGDGRGSFVFTLPADPSWAGNLASITLSGPGGSATLDADTAHPMTILLDPRTRQVRGILRDLPPPTQAAMDATGHGAGTELEELFSRGIPTPEAWRR